MVKKAHRDPYNVLASFLNSKPEASRREETASSQKKKSAEMERFVSGS